MKVRNYWGLKRLVEEKGSHYGVHKSEKLRTEKVPSSAKSLGGKRLGITRKKGRTIGMGSADTGIRMRGLQGSRCEEKKAETGPGKDSR